MCKTLVSVFVGEACFAKCKFKILEAWRKGMPCCPGLSLCCQCYHSESFMFSVNDGLSPDIQGDLGALVEESCRNVVFCPVL